MDGTVETVEEFIVKLEGALAATAGQTDPEVVDFRAHAEPVVDAYRGRRVLSADEEAIHAAWMTAFLERSGARVREILDTVGGTIQDIDHQGRLDRFLGRD
jgi:hypothetical protein